MPEIRLAADHARRHLRQQQALYGLYHNAQTPQLLADALSTQMGLNNINQTYKVERGCSYCGSHAKSTDNCTRCGGPR